MRGQIGNWGDCLDVGFTPSLAAHFDQFDTGRRVSVSVLIVEQRHEDGFLRRTRSLTVRPDRNGSIIGTAGGPHMALPFHSRFPHAQHPDLAMLRAPRFKLHEVTFAEPLFGEGGVCTTLDPDHLLPWPCLKDCAMYDCAEVLKADLRLRLASALRTGAKTLGAPMPNSLRDRMLPGTYKTALAEAKAVLEAEKAAHFEAALAA